MTVTIHGTNGVTSPEVTLDNSAADGGQVVLKSSGYSNWNLDNYSGRFRAYYNATEYFTINSSGNVGIGTSSPTAKLNVVGNSSNIVATFDKGATLQAATQLKNSAQTYSNYVDINNNGTNWWALYDATNAVLMDVYVPGASAYRAFYTVGTERMRIDSSGNVLVGGTYASTGQINILGAASAKTEIYMQRQGQVEGHIGFTASSSNSNWYFNTSPTLGNTGVYMANNSTAWTSNSDERLKTDLIPIENAVEKVSSLRAVTGRYKTDAEGTSRAFLIAQDVKEVLPEAISETELEGDDTIYYGVAYTDTIPLLVAAIKELSAKVTALEAKVNNV